MLMLRLEGHIVLWAAALLSVAAVTLRSPTEPDPASAEGSLAESVSVSARVASVSESAGQTYPRILPDLDPSSRTLFAVLPGLQVEQPAADPPAPIAALPLLKGVISDGATPRAVLSAADSPASYVTAAPGEIAIGYRIERIEADHVVAVSPEGEAVVLKLRGAGELP